jgi:hypothetical protein
MMNIHLNVGPNPSIQQAFHDASNRANKWFTFPTVTTKAKKQ